MDVERQRATRVEDERAIRAAEEAYDTAWKAGDPAQVAAFLTADAVVVNPFGEVTRGREAFVTFLAILFRDGTGRSTHRSTILRVTFVTDDVALADGEATIEGLPPAVAGGTDPVVHSFTDVFVRQGDAWRISQIRAYTHMARP